MSRKKKPKDPKTDALRERGTLHRSPEKVRKDCFRKVEFFDPRDLLQVKYEMLRCVQYEDWSVAEAARTFGFSRPSFYSAKAAFEREGIPGLLPRKRGPCGGHKLTAEVMAFVERECSKKPELTSAELSRRIEKRFGLSVHRRSVERALLRAKKKRD